LVWNAIRSSW